VYKRTWLTLRFGTENKLSLNGKRRSLSGLVDLYVQRPVKKCLRV
jgi:hypothetical protein